jgi:hypothetical protein
MRNSFALHSGENFRHGRDAWHIPGLLVIAFGGKVTKILVRAEFLGDDPSYFLDSGLDFGSPDNTFWFSRNKISS